MAGLKLCMFVILAATVAAGIKNVIQYEMDKLAKKEISDGTLWREQVLSPRKPTRLQKWGFKDCGGEDSLVTIKSLNIGPDPVFQPGPLDIDAMFDVKSDLVAPLKGNVTMFKYNKEEKKYVKVKCDVFFGSCVYDDVCALLALITACPDPLTKIGINCHCPIKKNSYNLPRTEFDLDASVFPAGDYSIIGNLTLSGREAGCLNITITFA